MPTQKTTKRSSGASSGASRRSNWVRKANRLMMDKPGNAQGYFQIGRKTPGKAMTG